MNPRNTYLIHGFNVKDGGASTIDRLLPYIREQSQESDIITQLDYGWFGLWSVMFHNKDVAKDLKAQQSKLVHSQACEAYTTTEGVFTRDYSQQYVIAHSNGCAILVEAAKRGAIFKRVLLINPALPCDTIFPSTIGEVLVVYTKHDTPTNAAKWGNRIPFLCLLVPNAWGAMGKYGSNRVKANNEQGVNVINIALHSLQGHSDLFTDSRLEAQATNLLRLLYGLTKVSNSSYVEPNYDNEEHY